MSLVAPDLLLDPDTWDLVLENGDLSLSSGADAAMQAIMQRIRFFLGEWFADESLGVPYWTEILGKKAPNIPAIREVFRQTILSAPGVASINKIDLAWASTGTRTMNLTFEAVMDDGTLLNTDGLQVGSP